jgi:hypothetical protein
MFVAWLHYTQYYCINMLKLLLSTLSHYDLLATSESVSESLSQSTCILTYRYPGARCHQRPCIQNPAVINIPHLPTILPGMLRNRDLPLANVAASKATHRLWGPRGEAQ